MSDTSRFLGTLVIVHVYMYGVFLGMRFSRKIVTFIKMDTCRIKLKRYSALLYVKALYIHEIENYFLYQRNITLRTIDTLVR